MVMVELGFIPIGEGTGLGRFVAHAIKGLEGCWLRLRISPVARAFGAKRIMEALFKTGTKRILRKRKGWKKGFEATEAL